MATAVGAGFDFSGLNKSIKEANAKIQKIVRDCEKAESSITKNFQNIAKNGVDAMTRSLSNAESKIKELTRTADSINRIVNIISKFNGKKIGGGELTYTKSDAETIKRLEKTIEKMQKTQDKTIKDVEKWKAKYESLSSSISKSGRSTGEVVREHEKLDGILGQIGRRIAAVFSVQSIVGYVNQIVEVRGEFEMQHKAMQVLIGDIDEANKLWNKTIDLAVKSPFKVKDLVTYTKQLSAYRIETDKLYDKTKMLADISAGLGVDMNRLILAYGQVKAANYLRGTELRQFSEAGINVLQELSTYFTELEGRAVSVGDVFDRVSKRLVSFADVDAVLTKVTSEGGAFYKMQEQQAETLAGMMMNLRDSVDLMMDSIGTENEGKIKNVVSSVKNLVDNWKDLYDVGKLWLGVLSPIIATSLLAKTSNIGLSKALGDLIYSTSLGTSAMMKYHTWIHAVEKTSKLGAKAIGFFGKAVGGLVGIVGTVAIIKLIEGISRYYLKVTEAERATKRLNAELEKIKGGDLESLNKASDGYANLVARLEYANEGSEKRREIIQKLNSEYGQYLGYVIDENTEVSKLAESYEDVVRIMTEKQGLATFEKGMEAISDSYGDSLKNAKEEFYELLEYSRNSIQDISQLKIKDKESGLLLIPSEKEIDEIYSILQQSSRELKSEEIDSLEEQRKLLNKIVSEYYGARYEVNTDEVYSLGIIDILVKKKEAEEELQRDINALYGETLKSREANLELSKLQLKYDKERKNIEQSAKSKFERNKLLEELEAVEEMAVIDLKVRFGIIEESAGEEMKRKIKEWETPLTKSINSAIRSAFLDSYSEEDLSNVIISRTTQREKGVSEYLKSIKSNWEQQNSIIAEQISLKDKGLSYDELMLSKAEKMEKLYRNVAEILGLELEYTERLSEESRNAINSMLPDEYKISIEEAYRGIDSILSNLKKKETEHLNVINQLNEQKKNGIPIDEDRLRLAEEGYLWTKKTQDLLDSSAKTPIATQKVSSINAKLEEKYRLNAIEQGKDEVTLLNEANSAKQNAIEYQEQLLAMQAQGVTITDEELALAKKDVEQLTLKWKLLGGIDKERAKRTTDNLTDEQIRVIDNMNKKYRELKKTLTEGESVEGAFAAYKDAFEKAYSGTKFLKGKNMKKMTAEQFTEEVLNFPNRNDIVKFLDELAKLPKELDDKVRIELAKGVHVEQMNVEIRKEEQDRLLEQIESMFGNYEIGLELDKLEIPQDLAKKIFGIESMDLNELRDAVMSVDTSRFGEDALKEYEEFTKKLEKMEDDARMERLKTYTKYLREEQDERIKIKLEEIRKLEEVEGMNEYDDTQKTTIKSNIRAEAARDMMKKSWESFEQSPDFLNLFDDISKASTQSLEDMRIQLDNLRGSMMAANLPASDLKEILDKINQVEEELENRQPFKSIKEDWSTLFGSDYKKALSDENKLLKERRDLEVEKRAIESSGPSDADLNMLNGEKEKLSMMARGSEEYRKQKELVEEITKALYPNQKRYNEILELLEQNGVKLDEVQRKTRKWKDSCLGIAEHFNAIGDAVSQVGNALGTTLDQMGLMSEETKAIYDSYMNIADNAFSLGGNIMKLVANPADPQAWVGAITNTISMIGNIAATGDAHRQKAIVAEMKNVSRLEKRYGQLEKAIDEAYNVDQLNANRMAMEQNIDAQITSLDSAKAKEEANKKVDQDAVDDYADQIAELEEKKAELQRNIVEGLGGTYDYKSVAEDFLNDWLTSFEETGDGLVGLEKSFDEFWKNILKKQVINRGAADIVKNYVSSINKALEDDSIISDQEEKDIAAAEELAKEKLNAYFAYMNEKYNLANLAEGELSGLQAGIQGITEEQAGILEAYWNAVRMDVSAVRVRFEDYANKMLSSDVEVNPMFSQLKTISSHTSAINTILESVAKNSADNGSLGIRVYMNNA